MGATTRDARFTGQDGANRSLLADEFPQRLSDGGDERKRRSDTFVPMVRKAFEVGGLDRAATLRMAAGTLEFRLDIQGAVVIGNLLSGLDIADRDFEIETRC
jgi:hypothetical protein